MPKDSSIHKASTWIGSATITLSVFSSSSRKCGPPIWRIPLSCRLSDMLMSLLDIDTEKPPFVVDGVWEVEYHTPLLMMCGQCLSLLS